MCELACYFYIATRSIPLSSSAQSGSPSGPLDDQANDQMSGYVADLQVHMALQALNLLPPLDMQKLGPAHQAQADVELSLIHI